LRVKIAYVYDDVAKKIFLDTAHAHLHLCIYICPSRWNLQF